MFEGPREIREVVEADGEGNFLGQSTLMVKAFAGSLQPVAQQMLAEACALLPHATHIKCAACAFVQHRARFTRQVYPEKTRITRRVLGMAWVLLRYIQALGPAKALVKGIGVRSQHC